jgi:hypothetical protein
MITAAHKWAGPIAVAAGFFTTALLSLGTDVVLHATGLFPPWGRPMSEALFVLAAAYRVVYTLLGGVVTARLAPDRPMRHVLVLGAIGIVVATAGVVATWEAGPELGPKWYSVSLVATALPCVWFGGWLSAVAQHRPAAARSGS